jgi:hypothetical protein
MDIVSHIEDGYFLSNVLGHFFDTKMLNQKGGEKWWITWKIKCFYNWDPISPKLLEDLRAPILGWLFNRMIKIGIVMVTLISLPFVPWLVVIIFSWSIFKNYVLANIVGELDNQTYFKVIAVIGIVIIWLLFIIN